MCELCSDSPCAKVDTPKKGKWNNTKHINIRTQTCAHTRTCAHAHVHTHAQAHARVRVHTHMHTSRRRYNALHCAAIINADLAVVRSMLKVAPDMVRFLNPLFRFERQTKTKMFRQNDESIDHQNRLQKRPEWAEMLSTSQ